MILAINASRARSGGARAHLKGVIGKFDPFKYGFLEIHIWSYKELLDTLPNEPWLFKHSHSLLERSLPFQIYWEMNKLKKEVAKINFNILLNVDAGTFARVSPSVVMSRDMLSYEPGEIERWPWGYMRLRLLALRYVQNFSMKRAEGVVFLTNYASRIIQESCGKLEKTKIIPHGIGDNFFGRKSNASETFSSEGIIKCVYVSPLWIFKHQWNVVQAVYELRLKGYLIELLLVGGGDNLGQKKLDEAISKYDPETEFITRIQNVANDRLPAIISKNDIFIFASSCENMPNTVLEGMASGLPIASSNRGPMPEVLEDGGVYFDPEKPSDIENALEKLVLNEELRKELMSNSRARIKFFSWSRCADETLQFLAETCQKFQGNC
jgi:glycosyltransferase involved in cell wall biosynthesis